MLKIIIFIMFIFSILALTIDLGWTYNKCPPVKKIYKFIPKTFADEQENLQPLSDVFGKMFDDPSPWIGQFNSQLKKTRLEYTEKMNKK